MKTMRTIGLVVFTASGLFASPVDGVAQPGPSWEGQERPTEDTRAAIRAAFQERISRELGLSEEQGAALVEIFADFREDRAALLPRRLELMRETRLVLNDPDDLGGEDREELARRVILRARELRREEADILLREEEALLGVLAPSQVLHFQVLRDQFTVRIRGLEGEGEARVRLRAPGTGPR